MNFLFISATFYPNNFKLPKNNEWNFIPETEWQFDYKIRVETTPTCIGSRGAKYWCLNGKLHRNNNLPARIDMENHYISYYVMSCKHRTNGPASISKYYLMWDINGVNIIVIHNNEYAASASDYINSKIRELTDYTLATLKQLTDEIETYIKAAPYGKHVLLLA